MGKIGEFLQAQSYAHSLLPSIMDSVEARVQELATAIQESDLQARRQKNNGPAVSIFQFERIGINEVLVNPKTRRFALAACDVFEVAPETESIWEVLQRQQYDAMAFMFCRLNYWRSRTPLPKLGNENESWNMYNRVWAPGKPHRDFWPESYWRAYGALIG